jgi:hypothetical protein
VALGASFELWFKILQGTLLFQISDLSIQGGSDKSGIFFFFLLNGTTQLKII